ncbi:MAG: hypothetical protein IT311_06345 [Anaerolineales bacterium]|nr:hypothetical protein [Anaerolineales bacterium]
MIDWILKFSWVLLIEYIQNLPIILGIVFSLAKLKQGWAWWKSLLMMIGSSFLCAFIISATEPLKIIPTTLEARPFDAPTVGSSGIIFSIACALLLAYILFTGKLKKPYLADWIFGALVGGGIALSEALNHFPLLLVALHAAGFMLASGCLVTLIRYAADSATPKALLTKVGLITLLMTVLIAIFDYAPFISQAAS